MKTYTFIALVTVGVLSYANAALSYDFCTVDLALQPDGLHKAALASGGACQTGALSPPKYRMVDLKQLVAGSPTIVVATVTKATPVLKDDGRFIFTNYQLDIIQTIKGDIAKTDMVEIIGGTYTFSDGSVVNWIEDVWKALRINTTYILFIKRWEDQPNLFRVVSAGQGIFEITSDSQRLVSYTYLQNDPLKDEAVAGKAAFLRKVQSIVADTAVPATGTEAAPAK